MKKRLIVFSASNGLCHYCGLCIDPITFHIDHIQPKIRGGKSCLENYAASCVSCNTTKGGKTLEEFRTLLSLKKSNYFGIITPSQYLKLRDLGELKELEKLTFHFEKQGCA